MKHWSKRSLHLLGWLAYGTYVWVGAYLDQWHPLSWQMGWLLLSMLVMRGLEFYGCYRLVFPRLLRPGRIPALVAALLGVIGLYIGVRYGIEEVLYPAVLGFRNYHPATTAAYYILDNVYYASPAIVISGVVWSFEETLRRERENQQLRQEKTQAEEAFLRTQISPHFLYNTLNYLYSLAYPVSEQLGAAVLKLSDLMRYMLHPRPDGQVELTREIAYLRNYIALYQLRFGGQFFVDFTVTGDPTSRRVAALLLIPFVENVFKHGVLNCANSPVRIQLTINAEDLLFEVDNQIGQHQKDATSGIGLTNVRRRLALLYPGRHTLTVGPAAERFRVLLQLRDR